MEFTKENLHQGLETRVIGAKLFVFESIDSTNTCAKTLAEAGVESGTVVLADHQTAGRGRNGRSWLSEPGANLLFSVVLRPQLTREQAFILTFYSSVAIARAVESVTGEQIECKWPNDLLLHGKKFCGILLENSFRQQAITHSIIGIGLNVNQIEFHGDLGSRATSLRKELSQWFDRRKLLQSILTSMEALFIEIDSGAFEEILQDWKSRCFMFGKPITVARPHDQVSGTAVGLSEDGGLIIETNQGKSVVYAGDVSILL